MQQCEFESRAGRVFVSPRNGACLTDVNGAELGQVSMKDALSSLRLFELFFSH